MAVRPRAVPRLRAPACFGLQACPRPWVFAACALCLACGYVVAGYAACGTVESGGIQFSTVTRVPIGVYGHTLAAAASGSSTQPRLCGVPKLERVKAWMASPWLK